MSAEIKLPEEILKALIENTKTMDANNKFLEDINAEKGKNSKVEENLIKKNKITSTLTSEESKRYDNIGKQLFSSVLISLENLIKKEKRRKEMLITDDTKTIESNLKKQYGDKTSAKKEKEGSSLISKILNFLIFGLPAIYFLFESYIKPFFSNLWDNLAKMFAPVKDFFSLENQDSPINKFLNFCSKSLSGLWGVITAAFTKAGNMGNTIWEGIKEGWERFITGPNGILNWASKVVDSIKDAASSMWGYIVDKFQEYIFDPITNLFSDAKKEGKDAAKEAAEEVKASANQMLADQAAVGKAINYNTMFSAQKTNDAIEKAATNVQDAAAKTANKLGLTVTSAQDISDEIVREQAARAGLEAFANANNLSIDENEYNRALEVFKEHVEISENNARIDMEHLSQSLSEAGDKESNWILPDSDFINALQGLKDNGGEQMNKINASVSQALAQSLQLKADLQAAENLKNMTEEERFEARLRQAMASGEAVNFRFIEGRRMILESVEAIKQALQIHDTQIREAFTNTWASFVSNFLSGFNIEIKTESPQDNSTNTYNIVPMDKQSLGAMSNKMLELAKTNTETLIQQNVVLEKIKELLSIPAEQTSVQTPQQVIANINTQLKSGITNVSQNIRRFTNELLQSSSPIA